MKKPLLFFFTFLLTLASAIYLVQQKSIREARAAGNTYYVPGNFSSIQAAVNAVQPGDTIYVRGGTYYESVRFSRSGQEGKPIILARYGTETVIINGGGSPAIVDQYGTEYWIIEGFTLDSNAQHTILFSAWGCNGTCGGTHYWIIRNNYIIGAVQILGSYNLFEGNEVDGSQHKGSEDGVWELYDVSHHNIYRNNHVHHFNSRGFWSMHRTHDTVYEDNHVHNIQGQEYSIGISADAYGTAEWKHTIRGNHVHDCDYAGIQLENNFDTVVENNIIHDNGHAGVLVMNYVECQAGGGYGGSNCAGLITNNIIRQNLIYRSRAYAGLLCTNAGGVKVWGNTIYGGSGPGVFLYSWEEIAGVPEGTNLTPGCEIRNNIIYANAREPIRAAPDTVIDHNFTTDPLFVDPANDNFHLRAGSPAIDAGIDIGLATDLDDNPRPQGAGYDIGAYEYTGSVQPTPTPTSPPTFNLYLGWNQITWPDISGKKASDIPIECPIAVAKENFWFKPHVKNFGGLNFNFESGRTYYLKCNQETIWQL